MTANVRAGEMFMEDNVEPRHGEGNEFTTFDDAHFTNEEIRKSHNSKKSAN